MQIECRSRPWIRTAEFRVAPVTDRHLLEPPVDDEVDERGRCENAVRDQVAAEPVERSTDHRADDDDREADFRIEVLARVKIRALAHWTYVHRTVGADRVAERQRDGTTASAARDFR